MRKIATKVAVSIPDDLYRAVERARRRQGKSRSAVMPDALRAWLDREAHVALVREYTPPHPPTPPVGERVE